MRLVPMKTIDNTILSHSYMFVVCALYIYMCAFDGVVVYEIFIRFRIRTYDIFFNTSKS